MSKEEAGNEDSKSNGDGSDPEMNQDDQIIGNFNKEDLMSNFYRNEWPEVNDLVAVEIFNVNEDGAYVKLLEYNDKEGLILATNTTRKRVKNVKKLLRQGTVDYMQVLHVDQEGGYIDLSKKTLHADDIVEKKKFFKKSQMVHLIMKLTAVTLGTKVQTCYENFGWDIQDHFEHALDAFKLSLTEPDLVFSKLNITEEEKAALIKNITKKLASAPVKMRTKFNLQCYSYEGIEAIKEAMIEAKKQTSDDEFKLEFSVDAAPLYQAEVVHLDKNTSIERLNKALGILQTEIKARGGIFRLVQQPTKIGARGDDVDNEDIMERMN